MKLTFHKAKIKLSLPVFLLLLCSLQLYSQKPDTTDIYKKIKNVSDKTKFASWIYNAVFVEPKAEEYPSKPVSKEEKIVNPYLKHESRIIKRIIVKVYDPFGHSINDTVDSKKNFLQKGGNTLHVSTRKWIIINKLLFTEGDSVNALSLSESERLLRQSPYVNDAKVFVSETESNNLVDVYVIVQDKWTVSMPVVLADVTSYARFRNENLFGSGNQFEQYVGYTRPDVMDYSGYYNLSNIDNTYISSKLFYTTDKDGTEAGLVFDRPFYSPLTEWAGGASAVRTWKYFPHIDSITGYIRNYNVNNSLIDVWLGKSIKLETRKSFFKQSTNIIIGERYYVNVFDKRPPFSIDAKRTNLNNSTLIGNVGFALQQFYKEKYIYRFGASEDVPHGLITQFIYGATENELGNSRYYLGAEIAGARHFKFGYMSAVASYGIFFAKSSNNDVTTNFKLNYFTDLFKLGNWYLREFVNGKVVYGLNKSVSDRTTLTYEEMYGFNSGNLAGESKFVLNSETVAYAPYSLIGFRFAPTLLAGCGIVTDQQSKLKDLNLYQAYAIALMVRNENLLTSTFQVSFGYYPLLPDGKNNIISYNPVTNFTLRVRVFTFSKPEFISY